MGTRTATICVFALFVLAATLIWTAPSAAKEDPPFDLANAVGLWLLNEGEGDIANDTSGTGNDGQLMGNTSEWVDGRFGKAVRFGGHFIWVRNAVNLPVQADPRTLMCAFKWPEVLWKAPGDRHGVAIGTGGIGVMGYGPLAFHSRVTLWIDDHESVGVETCYNTVLTPWDGDTDWHHLAAVLPEGAETTADFQIYFDGVLQETAPEGEAQITTVPGNINIGSQSGSNGMFFTGIIDDVAIFPIALPEEHIRSIARSGLLNSRAVQPSGKLATSWATLKVR